MAKYHGKGGAVFLATSAGGAVGLCAGLTEWSIDSTTDTVEVTSFQDTNKSYVQGLPDLKGSFSGYWDAADDRIFDAAASTDGAKMILYPAYPLVSGQYWHGVAWVDASPSANVADAVKVSGTFVAAGAWTRVG